MNSRDIAILVVARVAGLPVGAVWRAGEAMQAVGGWLVLRAHTADRWIADAARRWLSPDPRASHAYAAEIADLPHGRGPMTAYELYLFAHHPDELTVDELLDRTLCEHHYIGTLPWWGRQPMASL